MSGVRFENKYFLIVTKQTLTSFSNFKQLKNLNNLSLI